MFSQLDMSSPIYSSERRFRVKSPLMMSLETENCDYETKQSCHSIFKNRLIFNSMKVFVKYNNGKYQSKRIQFKGSTLVISSFWSTKNFHASSITSCCNSNLIVVIETKTGESISIKVDHITTAVSMALVLSKKDKIKSMYF